MDKKAVSISLITVLLLTMTACGWHLRGSAGNTLNFDHMYIRIANQRSALLRQLSKQLEASGVELVDLAAEANYQLIISNENSDRRAATVSAAARVSELWLTESAHFTVLDNQNTPVIPSTRVTVERIFEYDERNVLATTDETQLLKREMRSDLARQIYNHLRRLKKPAAGSNAPAS